MLASSPIQNFGIENSSDMEILPKNTTVGQYAMICSSTFVIVTVIKINITIDIDYSDCDQAFINAYCSYMHIAGYPKWFFTPAVQFTMCLIYVMDQFWTSLTLPETNIAPENGTSQKEGLSFFTTILQGQTVKLRGCVLEK